MGSDSLLCYSNYLIFGQWKLPESSCVLLTDTIPFLLFLPRFPPTHTHTLYLPHTPFLIMMFQVPLGLLGPQPKLGRECLLRSCRNSRQGIGCWEKTHQGKLETFLQPSADFRREIALLTETSRNPVSVTFLQFALSYKRRLLYHRVGRLNAQGKVSAPEKTNQVSSHSPATD